MQVDPSYIQIFNETYNLPNEQTLSAYVAVDHVIPGVHVITWGAVKQDGCKSGCVALHVIDASKYWKIFVYIFNFLSVTYFTKFVFSNFVISQKLISCYCTCGVCVPSSPSLGNSYTAVSSLDASAVLVITGCRHSKQ